jgi:hypothetical protein
MFDKSIENIIIMKPQNRRLINFKQIVNYNGKMENLEKKLYEEWLKS